MLGLALSTLRTRKAGFIGAFLALFCASALISACGMLLQTGLTGGIPTERYSGSSIVVAGDQSVSAVKKKKKGKTKIKSKPLAEHVWIPATVIDRVRSVPGVKQAVPEVTFPAYIVDHGQAVDGPSKSPSYGHGWESAPITPFTLRSGHVPESPGDVVIDADLADRAGAHIGSSVTIQATEVATQYRVTGIAKPPGHDGLSRQSTIFFSTDEARRLAGHAGQISSIGLVTSSGADVDDVSDRVEKAIAGTPAKVYPGDKRGGVEFLDASKAQVMLISLSGTLSATAVLVAILVVVSTFGLSIQQRYRELALLRAIAATPKQIRKLIGREALVVGLLGGVGGCLVSLPLASWLRGRFVAAGAIPDILKLSVGPAPWFAAVLAALVAAYVAARVAARRTTRIRPAEALAESAIEPPRPGAVRLIAGLIFTAGAVVLTIVLSTLSTEPAATPVTFLTSLIWVTAATLLGTILVRVATGFLAVPLKVLSPVGGYFAAANTQANAKRIAGVVTPLSLAVAMTCTILFGQTTLGHASQRQAQEGTTADYVLQSSGPGIASADVGAVRQVPGAATVTEVLHTQVRGVGLGKYSVQGVTPEHLGQTLDMGVKTGSINDMGANTAAMSTTAAARTGAHVGGQVDLRMGDSTPVSLKVIAIYDRGLGFPDLTLPHDLVAAHVDNPLDDTVLVKAAPGAKDLHKALAGRVKGVAGIHVTDRDGLREQQAAQQRANAKVALLAMGLIIAFTAIAVVNSLTMATADRFREFALLRLVGTTRRQVLRITRWESLVVTIVAVVIGTLISFLTLSAFSSGMTHTALPYVPPTSYLLVILGAAVLAFFSTDTAARLALRAQPADAINQRQ